MAPSYYKEKGVPLSIVVRTSGGVRIFFSHWANLKVFFYSVQRPIFRANFFKNTYKIYLFGDMTLAAAQPAQGLAPPVVRLGLWAGSASG